MTNTFDEPTATRKLLFCTFLLRRLVLAFLCGVVCQAIHCFARCLQFDSQNTIVKEP